ncbi:MAG: hypothetical protein WAM90_08805 [Rhodanobacter sp.]
MIPLYLPYEWYELSPQQQRDLLEEMALERELMQMLQERRQADQARAERYEARKFSPPATAPVLPRVALSPESAVAGTSFPMEIQA